MEEYTEFIEEYTEIEYLKIKNKIYKEVIKDLSIEIVEKNNTIKYLNQEINQLNEVLRYCGEKNTALEELIMRYDNTLTGVEIRKLINEIIVENRKKKPLEEFVKKHCNNNE